MKLLEDATPLLDKRSAAARENRLGQVLVFEKFLAQGVSV